MLVSKIERSRVVSLSPLQHIQLTRIIAVRKGASGRHTDLAVFRLCAPPLSYTTGHSEKCVTLFEHLVEPARVSGGALSLKRVRSVLRPLAPFPTAMN